MEEERSERKIIEFLACNTSFDGLDDLQWELRREYWRAGTQSHGEAIEACIRLARSCGITDPIYKGPDDPNRPRIEYRRPAQGKNTR